MHENEKRLAEIDLLAASINAKAAQVAATAEALRRSARTHRALASLGPAIVDTEAGWQPGSPEAQDNAALEATADLAIQATRTIRDNASALQQSTRGTRDQLDRP